MAIIALGLAIGAPRRHPRRTATAVVHDAGAPSVAGAYGYPARCLSITIPAGYPAYARADFNRARPCGRYSGTTTAILHRIGGKWHLILDATTYSCPAAAIPPAVQVALGVCGPP